MVKTIEPSGHIDHSRNKHNSELCIFTAFKNVIFQLGSESCIVKADAMAAALDATALKACKEDFPLNPSTNGWYWAGSCLFTDIDTKFDRLLSCYNNVMILVSVSFLKKMAKNFSTQGAIHSPEQCDHICQKVCLFGIILRVFVISEGLHIIRQNFELTFAKKSYAIGQIFTAIMDQISSK